VEHAQPLGRPFPWRAAAVAACVLALAELVSLIALISVGLIPIHHNSDATTPVAGPATPPATKPVAHPLRPRSHVSVLVLNGNGTSGAAGSEAARLLGHGYRSTDSANAPSHGYARSLVLFRPGWGQEARRLASDAGIRAVTPLDGRLPGSDARYQLVLILGAN
jgi:LytR cell envelope-related transcriptional attenuator